MLWLYLLCCIINAMQHQQATNIVLTTTAGSYNALTKVITLELRSGCFPDSITVVSHRTGKSVLFNLDTEKAERHEYWDGEMAEYRSERAALFDITVVLTRGK